MTICPWCGQQTQSDSVCEWCKRPVDRKSGPPPGTRNDLDFLREEADTDKYSIIRWAVVGVFAVACGAALFFMLRGSNSVPDSSSVADGGPPKPTPGAAAPSAQLVSAPAFQAHRPDFWVQQWNNGADLISNANGPRWTTTAPTTRASASLTTNVSTNSPVKITNVVMSMVSLPGGLKRAVGRADIVNTSTRNVIDFRAELIWGANAYSMIALQGNNKSLHQVYDRALRPGKKIVVQLLSLKIKDHPMGSPNAVELTAFLDGSPGTAIDEYQLQLGR
jgi:hypothetical protein